MSRITVVITIAALIGVAATGPVFGKSLLTPIFPVSGSAETDVFGIHDGNPTIITGSWYDSNNIEHGYVGPITGSAYTSFDAPAESGTEPRGINDGGYITGFGSSGNSSPSADIPFVRAPNGTITNVTMRGTTLNYLIQGINSKNAFTGGYLNTNLQVAGYVGSNTKYAKSFKLANIINTGFAGRGINDKGDVVGWYYDTNSVRHGFLLSGKTVVTIDFPSKAAVSTVLEGINDRGTITGQWTDNRTDIHGFLYDSKNRAFTSIEVPGSNSFVQAWGISDSGLVAIGSDAGYFIWCPTQKNCVSATVAGKPQRPARKLSPKTP